MRAPWRGTEVPPVLQLGSGRAQVASIERDQPPVQHPLLPQGRVVVVCRQVDALLAHLASQAQPGLDQMKPIEALERLTALRRRPHLLRQREGPGVALTHGRHRVPLRRHQAQPQEQQEREFVLGTRRALGEGRQQRQPFGEGGDGFVIGMAPDGRV
jgi:hypothetical protein